MKKLIIIAALIIFNLCVIDARGQIKLSPAQIKEIVVHNAVAGMGGGTSADIEVIAEGGKWHSYLIRRTSDNTQSRIKPVDSALHKFIAGVSPVLVNNLLNSIAVIKPAITPSTYGLTTQGLIADLKNSAKLPVKHTPDFKKLLAQQVIDHVIKNTVVKIDAMDDYEYCEVDIVTRRNDTIKLTTGNLCPTKLPWMIRDRATYNMAINNFVVAAIGIEDVPNKAALNINSLKEGIYKYVDERNTGAPVATFKFEHDYPVNQQLMSKHFFKIDAGLLSCDVYSCTLRTSAMPANAILESRVNMASSEDIKSVITYAALIDKFFTTGNFVFNYYSNRKDCQLDFVYDYSRSPYISLTYLGPKLPEQAKADSAQTISFGVSAPDDVSNWILFPDNKALLTYHAVTTSDGKTAPIYPLQDPNDDWPKRFDTFYLFNSAGKLLIQGRGF